MEIKDRLKFLLGRFNEGIANPAQLAELEQLLNEPGATALLDELWDKVPVGAQFFDEGATKSMLAKIEARKQRQKRTQRMTLAMAASAIIIVTCSLLYWNTTNKKPATPAVTHNKKSSLPVLPGINKAVLVLADGSAIELDSAGNTNIALQGNTQIAQINGQVIYTSTDSATQLYNLLKTPNGGQYQLQLADGSKVWMNAGSSLYFPTAFSGNERMVQLTGEAYFEVAKDAKRPFRVKVNDVSVNVLGTHFNVMAYDNEHAAAVTLLEGAVQIQRKNDKVNMHPGQQVLAAGEASLKLLNNVDLEEAVAWKNGYFVSNNTSLAVLLRQFERWYEVEIVYEGKVPNRKFGGKIPRTSELREVMKVLELSKVYTKLEGNKITVLDR